MIQKRIEREGSPLGQSAPRKHLAPLERAVELYQSMFRSGPEWVIRAPGRLNLIGEHTDYNGGFVLPIAVDKTLWIAGGARAGMEVSVHSAQENSTCEFSLSPLAAGSVAAGSNIGGSSIGGSDVGGSNVGGSDVGGSAIAASAVRAGWAEYVRGAARVLSDLGRKLQGWQGVIVSDIPAGAGLASSAALTIALLHAFLERAGGDLQVVELAKAARRVENDYAGVTCGIMDPLVCEAARAGHALFIDCRSLETLHVPMPRGVAVVMLDSLTRRDLRASPYNERREQCLAAAKSLGVNDLRDVSPGFLEQRSLGTYPIHYRRARHVITENERTISAVEALRRGDAVEMGRLMNKSHESLRTDFDASRQELDALVAAARAQPGCLGARLTGGGFGGAAVALVTEAAASAFVPAVRAAYERETSIAAQVEILHTCDGARLIPLV